MVADDGRWGSRRPVGYYHSFQRIVCVRGGLARSCAACMRLSCASVVHIMHAARTSSRRCLDCLHASLLLPTTNVVAWTGACGAFTCIHPTPLVHLFHTSCTSVHSNHIDCCSSHVPPSHISRVPQDEMRLALLLCVVDPKIGGVMIMGACDAVEYVRVCLWTRRWYMCYAPAPASDSFASGCTCVRCTGWNQPQDPSHWLITRAVPSSHMHLTQLLTPYHTSHTSFPHQIPHI